LILTCSHRSRNQSKACSHRRLLKKVEKAILKFFLYNAIPFNVADSGHYYQAMIDTIAEADPNVKSPTGYQIGNQYLKEEVKKVEGYIATIKAK